VNNHGLCNATTWLAYRNGQLDEQRKGCGILQIDGGETWLPIHKTWFAKKGMLGKIGIAVSPQIQTVCTRLSKTRTMDFSPPDAGEH
jgi:hypothetical protein